MNYRVLKVVAGIATALFSTVCGAQPTTAPGAAGAGDTLGLMSKVFDWQQSVMPTQKTYRNDSPTGWIRAPFYDGAMAMYETTHEQKYLKAVTDLGESVHWDLLRRPKSASGLPGAKELKGDAAKEPYDRFADDLALGQAYIRAYQAQKNEAYIDPLKKRLDGIVANPLPGREEWWWCDALYMAPPVFVGMSQVTGDRKYVDYGDKQFWDVYEKLYSKDEHLFFRDASYFEKKEANGKPVFWSRGNGWVMAGLAHIINGLPSDHPSRSKYVALFNEMAEKIASLQQEDGSWRVSLLDPETYPGKETSGTGFYCFAMAWGINHGVLPAEKYKPVVEKAWAALLGNIDPSSGKVGFVQPVGAAPVAGVKESDTAQYGTGAVLLAGVEMSKLK